MTPSLEASLPSDVPLVLVLDHPGPDFAVEAAILGQAGVRAVSADSLTRAELSATLARADAIMTALAPVTDDLMHSAAWRGADGASRVA